HVGLDRSRSAGTRCRHDERFGTILLRQNHFPVVGALDGGHPGGDGQLVVVVADLLERLHARDRRRENTAVLQAVVHHVGGCLQLRGTGDSHSFSLFRDAAWVRRSSNNSEGEIGMLVIGMPSASSTAAAITAEVGMTPASPAPFIPRGLSADGVTVWSISSESGISVTKGMRKSMYDALSICPCSS